VPKIALERRSQAIDLIEPVQRFSGDSKPHFGANAQSARHRLKLRHGIMARWHTGTAQVLPDDDARERQRWLAGRRPSTAANAAAVRVFGTDLLTVRIDLD
jgi:hypothetical protein